MNFGSIKQYKAKMKRYLHLKRFLDLSAKTS